MAFDITCDYKTDTDWWAINDVYYCDVKFDVEITKSNAVVTSIDGSHSNYNSNADVVGFRAQNVKLHYFPQGLSKFFDAEKIKFIAVWSTGLKEIHQGDLYPFTKLRVLSLWNNDFEVLERDLFKFNPEINYLGLGKNKIKFVDGNVFRPLKNLHSLYIDGNRCISKEAVGDKNQVSVLIDEIREKCEMDNDIATGNDFQFDVRIRVDSTQ